MNSSASAQSKIQILYLSFCRACLDKASNLLAPRLVIHSLDDVRLDVKEVIATLNEMKDTVFKGDNANFRMK